MEFIPEFYNAFKCIAGKCPDSCCKDWDIAVDDETAEAYNSLEGEFGDKIRSLMTVDEYGDRIFISQNGKCPFWNSEKLCDIQANCGEDYLCINCNNFPRLTQDYTVFIEYMLSFACPEAARLMLSDPDCIECPDNYDVNDAYDYDPEIMKFLLTARKISFDFFNTSDSFNSALLKCYSFNKRVQKMLDSLTYDLLILKNLPHLEPTDIPERDKIFDLHKNFDIMSREFFDNIQKARPCTSEVTEPIDSELKTLAKYYIYRYYLTAIDNFDVITTLNRILCAGTVIPSLITLIGCQSDFDRRVLIFQRYSKEIEYSNENTFF